MSELFSRQRDLLPLPPPFPDAGGLCQAQHASRWVRRRLLATGRWQQWANDAARTLNDFYGGCSPVPEFASSLQAPCLARIANACERVGRPPAEMSPAGAFVELCGASLPYLADAGGLMPYDKGLVSLLGIGATPFPCEESLSPAHRDLVVGDRASMLSSSDETAAALEREGVKPYVDPAFRSPNVYVESLSSLHERGLITWEQNLSSTCGLLFVAKKNGRLRMILDTRVAN